MKTSRLLQRMILKQSQKFTKMLGMYHTITACEGTSIEISEICRYHL